MKNLRLINKIPNIQLQIISMMVLLSLHALRAFASDMPPYSETSEQEQHELVQRLTDQGLTVELLKFNDPKDGLILGQGQLSVTIENRSNQTLCFFKEHLSEYNGVSLLSASSIMGPKGRSLYPMIEEFRFNKFSKKNFRRLKRAQSVIAELGTGVWGIEEPGEHRMYWIYFAPFCKELPRKNFSFDYGNGGVRPYSTDLRKLSHDERRVQDQRHHVSASNRDGIVFILVLDLDVPLDMIDAEYE